MVLVVCDQTRTAFGQPTGYHHGGGGQDLAIRVAFGTRHGGSGTYGTRMGNGLLGRWWGECFWFQAVGT